MAGKGPQLRNDRGGRVSRASYLALVLAVLLAALAPASPADGRVRVNASFELRETYDNNAFLLRRSKVDDFITTISPTISASYRGPRLEIDLESGASFYVYGQNDSLNDQFFHQRFRLEYKLGPQLSLEAENLYTYVTETIGRPDDLASNLVQSNSWRVGPIFRSDLGGRSRAEIKASYGGTNYVDGDFLGGEKPDFGEARASLYLDRELSERILVYTTQEFTRRDFTKVDEATFSGLLSEAGLRWRIGRLLSLDLSGGYQWLRFDKLGTESGSIIDVAIHYTPTFRTRVTAAYSQLFTSDVLGKVFKQDRVSLGLERQMGPRTLLELTSFFSQLEQRKASPSDDNFFGGGVKLDHKLRRHLHLTSEWSWWQNAGALESDDYERMRGTVGLKYEF